MKKKIFAVISIIYNLFKFNFIKIFYYKNFIFEGLYLISPSTEIEVGKKSTLKIGKKVKIRSGSKIHVRDKGRLEIGAHSFFNSGCFLVCHDNIQIGKNVQLGPNVLIYDHDHDFRKQNGLANLKYKTSPIIIGDNVWIGGNSVILRGTTIEDNVIIGAGSVIKGHYEKNSLIIQKRETLKKIYKEEFLESE